MRFSTRNCGASIIAVGAAASVILLSLAAAHLAGSRFSKISEAEPAAPAGALPDRPSDLARGPGIPTAPATGGAPTVAIYGHEHTVVADGKTIPDPVNVAARMEAFASWLHAAAVRPEATRWNGESLAQGVALARDRRAALKSLIMMDPAAALKQAVPASVRRGLPAEVDAELEQVVAGRGDYLVLCAENRLGTPRPGSTYLRRFTLGDRVYQAFVYGRRLTQVSSSTATFHGIAVDDVMAVSAEPLRVLESNEVMAALASGQLAAEVECAVTGASLVVGPTTTVVQHGDRLLALAAAEGVVELNRQLMSVEAGFRRPTDPPSFSAWSHGNKSLLFMRARFPDDLREPISETDAAAVMRLANEFYVANSFKNVSLVGTVGPLITLPQPKLYYATQGPGTLLDDARAATRAAGLDPETFDLDMVRFEAVPGFDWGGLGAVGGRGVWLQSSDLSVICHELGHNMGLSHGNFWNTVRPELPEDTRNLPFDGDSEVGIDSVIGPGDDVEYGDPFDTMGGGGGMQAHFSGLHKYLLGWIPESAVFAVTNTGTYRIVAHDGGDLGAGVAEVLRISKDFERSYWVSARSQYPGNPWLNNGVELHWNNWHQAIGSSEILDTTPGTRHGKDDAAVVLGRTFSDASARVHITPVARGSTELQGRRALYYDVRVEIGAFPSNTAPRLELEATATSVSVGVPVTFTAAGTDADGDSLSYSWDMGEGSPGGNRPQVSRVWSAPGDYVVRCEVSDFHGGVAARHLIVRVGSPATLRVAGRVIDQSGRPLIGVRVHNGRAETNSPYAADYRWGITDSDGRYTLVGLQAGDYRMGGVLDGYDVRPLNFGKPLVLNQFTGVDVDFIATALPRVSVSVVQDGQESTGRPVTFRVARAGPTNDTLRVFFRTSGTAEPEKDYKPWAATEVQTNTIPTALNPATQTIEYGYVDLGPGLLSTNLSFPVMSKDASEGDESLVVTLAYPVTRTTITETSTNTVDIPGWEVLSDQGQDTWFQTRVLYQLGAAAEARARIIDAEAPTNSTISIVALENEVSEFAGDSATFVLVRSGPPSTTTLRIPIQVSGTAEAGQDFEPLAETIEFPPGADAVRLVVNVWDDQFVEGNEEMAVTLRPGTGYRLGNPSASIVIVDNDLPSVTVSAIDSVVAEGAPSGRISFQRTGDLGKPLEVDYLLGGTAKVGIDYAPMEGRVTLPAGASSLTVQVFPIDDTAIEGDETIEVTVGDSPIYNIGNPGRAILRLRDDEFPVVTVSATDAEAAEGDDPGVFTIRRTGALGEALRVYYRFGGSAVHQADYVASGDQILIPAGQSQVSITVTPIDDNRREDDETIDLELIPDPTYTLGQPSGAEVTLVDNGDAQPAVGFVLLSSRGLESQENANLAVRISGNPDEGDDKAVTVAWEVLGGSASNGSDYVLTNGTLVFSYTDPEGDEPLGNRIGIIPLKVINDLLPEPDENLLVRLRITGTELPSEDTNNPPTFVTNGVSDVYAVHTYTILDDDQSRIEVSASSPQTSETPGDPVWFSIRRTGRTNLAQVVTFQLSGSAVPASDYLDFDRVITFAPGQNEVRLTLVPVDDPVGEYREDVVLTLLTAPGAGFVKDHDRATISIEDNDGTIEFVSARYDASEGDGAARVTVQRTGSTNAAATVFFQASAGTATPFVAGRDQGSGDFVSTNGMLTFAPGVWRLEFEVPVIDDDVVEDSETVELQLSRGSDLFPLGGQNHAILTIHDNDSLLSPGTNVLEAVESDAAVEVTLVRSGPVNQPLSVLFQTANADAVAGEDYEFTEGVLEFPAGQREVQLRIPLIDDAVIEGNETFVLQVLDVDHVPLGEIPVTIVDDDCSLEISSVTQEIDEDLGVVEIVVHRSGSALMPVSVNYATVSGTATGGEDFVAKSGTLGFLGNRYETLTNGTGEVVFRSGETNQVIAVAIINDSLGEPDEAFELRLSNPRVTPPLTAASSVTLGSSSNATVVIRDNETPGRVDDQFQPGLGADATVRSLALQVDGKILVGGDFERFDGVVMPGLARLHADGFVDRSFNPGRGFPGGVYAVREIADGRILVGGTFTNADANVSPYLARLEPDGTLSGGFATQPDGAVHVVVGGVKPILGGDFSRVAGLTSPGVVRLASDGSLDRTFTTGADGRAGVRSALVFDDGTLLVGGEFVNWGGDGGRYLAALNADGSIDRARVSTVQPDGPVRTLVRAEDGSVYVGGEFRALGGIPRHRVARLLAAGGLDPGFDPGDGADAAVYGFGVQEGARVVVAGAFERFAGEAAGRFLRLQASGLADDTFFRGAGANGVIRVLTVQPDGAFLIGGDFTSVNGRPRARVARIHADEKFAEGNVEFAQSVWTVAETEAEAVLEVQRSGLAKNAAQVSYASAGISAVEGEDYLPASGLVTFAPGETRQQVRVRLRDDTLAEGSEALLLWLTNAVGARYGRQTTATLVITDNEAAVAFDLPSARVMENEGPLEVVVRRSGSLLSEASVQFEAVSDTAIAGEDFAISRGSITFAPGVATATLRVPMLDDSQIEGIENFRIVLSAPSGGLQLGSQREIRVAIDDDDRPLTHYTLTVNQSPGGLVIPAGGQFPIQSTQMVTAIPGRDFEFARWEGTVVSAQNPLPLVMDRNHVLTARFRSREYLESFESGDFSQLPWQSAGDAPWVVTAETASGGQYSARSGDVRDRATSTLVLVRETGIGGGTFEFRTASEAGWDFLEFYLNGQLVEHWSGINGWQAYAFQVPAGLNRFEWRFHRDATFGGAADAVWIDNLDLPEVVDSLEPPRLSWSHSTPGCSVQVQSVAGRTHVLERSLDLRSWSPVQTLESPSAEFLMTDPGCGEAGVRFYRVRVE
ncbi:MAG: PKD domain-containing protein [Verrucomicrobiales bacterium]|nr:PKD domain-containing protein [Verrucomicrobiales bacterium]